jgi:hypothetical protein
MEVLINGTIDLCFEGLIEASNNHDLLTILKSILSFHSCDRSTVRPLYEGVSIDWIPSQIDRSSEVTVRPLHENHDIEILIDSIHSMFAVEVGLHTVFLNKVISYLHS